jgi:hypothetical protein
VAYARADWNWLEKAQQPGPRSSPLMSKTYLKSDHFNGGGSDWYLKQGS